MYVWPLHIARERINRLRLLILLVVSLTGENISSLSPFAPENLVSRDGFGSPVPLYICMYSHTYRTRKGQPVKVANPVRGKLSRENE